MNLNNKRMFRKNLIIISLGLALSACGSDGAEEIIDIIEDPVVVIPDNSAPTISSTGSVTVKSGSEYSYTLSSADSDGDSLTLSASSLPAWLSFDEAMGVLSGTPADSDVGNHDITLTVSDGTAEITQTFTIAVTLVDAVNTAPVINSAAIETIEVGSAYSYTLAATDADADSLAMSATTIPAWLSFDDSTGILSGTPAESDIGEHAIILSVTDDTEAVTQEFIVAVTAVITEPTNNAPVVTSTAIVATEAGTDYTYTLVSTDADDDSLTMAATTLPEWLSFDEDTGILSGTSAAGDTGDHAVVLTVSDGSDEVTDSFTIAVSDYAPVITLVGLATINHDLGTDYVDEGATAVDTIDGTVTVITTGAVEATVGTYTLTYTAEDSAGNVATKSREVIVTEPGADEAPRDASEATVIISDGHNDWESWIEVNGSSQVIVDDNAAYDNVNEVTITASQFVAGYRPVDSVGAPIDMSASASTGTFEFDLKVTTAPVGTEEWFLKIESAAAATGDYSIFKDNGDHSAIELDVWQHYSFNLSDLAAAGLDLATIKNVMLFPAWGSNGGAVYQLDNFAFYPDGALEKEESTPGDSGDGATTTVGAGVDFEGPQLTWSSFDTDVVQYVANPVTTGINTSATAALFDVLEGNGEWIGALTQGITSFALDTSNCLVKMDVYKDTISDVHVKFQKNNGVNGDGIMWGSHGSVGVANTVVNQWETLTFDTCHWVGLAETDDIGALAIFPDKTAGRSQDTMNYIDNIMFTGGVIVQEGPTALVADPILAAGDVISLHTSGDVYGNITVNDWNPNWSQGGSISDATVAGKTVKKVDLVNYQGIEFATTDITGKATLHMSVYADSAAAFNVFVITGAGDVAVSTGPLVADAWNEIEVDLSATGSLSTASQIKFDGGTGQTLWLDNIYFHAGGDVVEGDFVAVGTPYDFEVAGLGGDFTWAVFENEANDALEFVANPSADAVNGSAIVAKITAKQAGQAWAGTETTAANTTPFTMDATNSIVKIMVYKSVISDVALKFSVGAGAQPEIKVANTKINEWEELTFDFTGYIGLPQSIGIDSMIVFPDFDGARAQDNVVYFDNITFGHNE